MAYDPNALMGLDSLSPTVSAYKNFVQQKDKVNDTNIVPFLLTRGEPQLAGLIAKKLRLENATKQQQQMAQQPPAAPPTVAQQYDAALAQQAPRMPQPQMTPPAQQPPAAGGVAAMPNPAMARGFAGGGIVAFQGGGASMGAATWDQLEDAFTRASPAEQARILQWADKNMPTFAKWARSGVPGTGIVKAGAKVAAPIAAGMSAFGAAQSDPESIQETSRLAQLGMTVDPRSKLKTGLATLAGVVESALPTSMFYDTPIDRALANTEKRLTGIGKAPGAKEDLRGSEDEIALANQYSEIVKKHGPNSPEARAFATAYRRQMGIVEEAPAAPADATKPPAAPAAVDKRPAAGGRTSTAGAKTPAAGTAPPRSVLDIGTAPNLKTLSEEQEAFYKETGTGTHSKALADQNKFIDEEAKRLGGDRKQAEKNFWIMTGASLLGSRSPYFANALGDSVKENYGNLIKDLKDIRKENRELEGMRIQLQRAQEQAIETGRRDVITRFDALSARYEAKQMKLLEMENDARDKALNRHVQLEVARMYSSGKKDAGDELWSMWKSTQEEGISPEEKARRQRQLIEAREAARENVRASSPTAYSADQSREARAEAALNKLRMTPAYVYASPEEQARMEARIRGASSMAGSQAGYVPQSGNVRNPYADRSDEEILALMGQ
jgi:hypothetical protein